ncbi:zinc dependent phospholipase C family protein [Tateyamaria sp. SN6-1]|uniref:zinc dependent phospholipase C family protein n=1 Tax=Tateyamaria sp. SN6-1 TaxID=3092148 RepID=UPI0039F44A12
MSGPCVHLLIADKILDEAETLAEISIGGMTGDVALETFSAHFALGAQGPDFLFFLPADGGNDLTKALANAVISTSADLAAANDELVETVPKLKTAIQKKRELTRKASNAVLSVEAVKKFNEDLNDLQSTFSMVIMTRINAAIAATGNVFDLFSILESPLQTPSPGNEWWWFDVLHYRRSGAFATNLLRKALADDDLELFAFACGYISHYCADTVGHPYVNMIARGPYRTHGQRHKVVENGQDVWAWEKFHQEFTRRSQVNVTGYFRDRYGAVEGTAQRKKMDAGEFRTSHLHLEYQFDPVFKTVDRKAVKDHFGLLPELDPAIALPQSIATGLRAAMAATYGDMKDSDVPDVPSETEIETSYRLWHKFFLSSSGNALIDPNIIPSDLNIPLTVTIQSEINNVLQEVAETLEASAKKAKRAFKTLGPSRRRRKKKWWESLRDFFKGMKEAIINGITRGVEILKSLVQRAVEVTDEVFVFLLQQGFDAIYASYLQSVKMLAALGFGFPPASMMKEDVFRHMIEPGVFPDIAGRKLSQPDVGDAYPMNSVGGLVLEAEAFGKTLQSWEVSFLKGESHLIYPPADVGVEEPSRLLGRRPLRAGPTDYASKTAEHYMWAVPGPTPDIVQAFFAAGEAVEAAVAEEIAAGDAAGTQPERDLTETHHVEAVQELGNAKDLTIGSILHLARTPGAVLPNVNLDADRGFAWPSWLRRQSERPGFRTKFDLGGATA